MASQVHGLHCVSDNSHKFGALSGSVRLVLDLLVAATVPQILGFLVPRNPMQGHSGSVPGSADLGSPLGRRKPCLQLSPPSDAV
jgi:hypothetical protein